MTLEQKVIQLNKLKTCAFQKEENQILILPFSIALEVIERMRNNPKCFIHLIEDIWDEGVKLKITYHYD